MLRELQIKGSSSFAELGAQEEGEGKEWWVSVEYQARTERCTFPFPQLRLRLVQRCLSRKPQWNAQLKGFQIRRNADEQKMEAHQGN